MTDLGSLTQDEGSPKKRLRINIPKVEFDSAELGKIFIGHLSVGAMLKVSKLMKKLKSVTGDKIARTLFQAVVVIPPIEEGVDERSVNSDELERISDAEIESFAAVFNAQQGWSLDQGDVAGSGSQVQLLNKKLRDELKDFDQSVSKSFKFSNNLFSEETRRLVSESALVGERLKEISGVSRLAEQLAYPNSGIARAMEAINSASLKSAKEAVSGIAQSGSASKILEEKMRSTVSGIAAQAEAIKTINQRASPAVNQFESIPKLQDLSESMRRANENSPMARSAKTLTALDSKVDEVLEIAQTVAELHGKTNEAILSGLANLAEKWNQDKRSASTSFKWAAAGICISAIIATVAVIQDYATNKNNDKQQLEIKAMMEAQLNLAKDMAKEQSEHILDQEKRMQELETTRAKQSIDQRNRSNKLKLATP